MYGLFTQTVEHHTCQTGCGDALPRLLNEAHDPGVQIDSTSCSECLNSSGAFSLHTADPNDVHLQAPTIMPK